LKRHEFGGNNIDISHIGIFGFENLKEMKLLNEKILLKEYKEMEKIKYGKIPLEYEFNTGNFI
jgi:hypothetical protein